MSALSTRAVNNIIKIVDTSAEEWRKILNKNIHVADLSIQALRVSVPNIQAEDYSLILEALYKSNIQNSNSLEYTMKQTRSKEWRTTLVDDKEFGLFLVAINYRTLQKNLSKVLKSANITNSVLAPLVGTTETGKTLARVGHIASDYINTTTPLSEKILAIAKRLPQVAANKVLQHLYNLQNTHIWGAEYTFTRESVNVERLSKILGRGTIYVTLQSDEKNSEFSVVEKRISNEIARYIKSDEFKQDLVREPGSLTMLEEIEKAIRVALGSKESKISPHSGSKKATKSTKITGTGKVVSAKLPQIRTTTGQFYSLNSLQQLINYHLQNVLSANMGNGLRSDILNYRTGRFAASVEVTRMSQSREGMITAYYQYMRNPYATFATGGRQEVPRTRNPELLIAKSIREIAATKVANRMRAVTV